MPLLSPRDVNGAPDAAIFFKASSTSCEPATFAGSDFGPTITKSLYITSRRSMPKPSSTNFCSATWSWTSTTSASPLRAVASACPVPCATTRTSMPVFDLNAGSKCLKRPESSVDVVDATTMKLSWACDGSDADASANAIDAASSRNMQSTRRNPEITTTALL